MVRETFVQTSRLCRELEDYRNPDSVRHLSFLPRVFDINTTQTLQSLGLFGHVSPGSSIPGVQTSREQTGPEVWKCVRLDLFDTW